MKRYKLVPLLVIISILMIVFAERGIKLLKQNSKKSNEEPMNTENENNQPFLDYIVALDAGHGGSDPGKVGVNEALEKDINLMITTELKKLLEEKGFTVIMTRTSDEAVAQSSTSLNKSEDMKGRVEIIDKAEADIAISIHQNSFTSSSSKGAQVFYYRTSKEGLTLAVTIQETMKELLADGNKRAAKDNDTYYLLRKVPCPIVIVEYCVL